MDNKEKKELQEIIDKHLRDRIFKEELKRRCPKLIKIILIPIAAILAAVLILMNDKVDWGYFLELMIPIILP